MLARKIFENPNAILHNGEVVKWSTKNCIAFARHGKDERLYTTIDTHMGLVYDLSKQGVNIPYGNSGRSKDSGRLFVDLKIITFWVFPKNKEDFLQLISELNDITGVGIDDTWSVEVLKYDDRNIDVPDPGWGNWYPKESEVEYIPIADYEGGYRRSQSELKAAHEDSPLLKKNRSVPTGIGSKKTTWPKHLKPFESYTTINENPNAIIPPKVWQKFYDKGDTSFKPSSVEYNDYDEIISFSYSPDGIVTGTGGRMHDNLRYKGLRLGRTKKSGRVFPKEKVITFWNYPKDFNEFMDVLKDLMRTHDELDFSDTDWRVEIPWGLYKEKINNAKDGSWGSWKPMIIDQKYIPLSQFKGGYQRSPEELKQLHLRGGREVADGFGSKFKKGNSTADSRNRWRMAKPFESYNQ